MTALVLLDDLKQFIANAVKSFRLTSGKTLAAPKVHKGYLPLNGDDDGPAFPYVIVRLTKVSDTGNGSTARILILIGTQSEDDDGYIDAWNVGERIRQALLTNRILSNLFSLQLPLELESPEREQPYPEAICWLTTLWQVPQPQNKLEDGVYGEDIPGSGQI